MMAPSAPSGGIKTTSSTTLRTPVVARIATAWRDEPRASSDENGIPAARKLDPNQNAP
jgi:hypothetical protein